MDPSYWTTAALKHTSQSGTDNTSRNTDLGQANQVNTNALYQLDLLQLLERQRLGLAANLFVQQSNLLSQSGGNSSSTSPPTISYSTSLLDASANQGLYAYTGSALTPQSTVPILSGSTLTYDNLLQHGVLPESHLLQTNQLPLILSQSSADTSKNIGSLQGKLPESNVLSLGYERPGTSQEMQQQYTLTQPQQESTRVAQRTGRDGAGYNHESSTASSGITINQDLESRYFSLSDFIENTVGRQNLDTYTSGFSQSTSRQSNEGYSTSGRIDARAGTNVQALSSTLLKTNPTGVESISAGNLGRSSMVTNQTISNPELLQYVKSDAVDLSSMNKSSDKQSEQYLTVNTGELMSQYNFLTPDGRLLIIDASDQASLTAAAQKGYMLVMSQPYETLTNKSYEAVSPPPTVDLSHSSTLNLIDAFYPSVVEATRQNVIQGGTGLMYTSAGSQQVLSSDATASSHYTAGSSSTAGASAGRKKAGESGVGIVLPMPQARDTTPAHSNSMSRPTVSTTGYISGVGQKSDPYQQTPVSGVNVRGAESAGVKQANSVSRGAEAADTSQPIYLANINGNIYVNQYTMLQPGGANSGPSELTLSADEYSALQELGGTVVHPGSYQTIDSTGYAGVLDPSMYQTILQQQQQYIPEESVNNTEPAIQNNITTETASVSAISKSTMLVPDQDDQELGHLVTNQAKTGGRAPKVEGQPKISAPVTTRSLMESSMNEIVTAVTSPNTSSIQEPKTLANIKAKKPSNAFENSFLKFLCGEKSETLASVVSAPIRNKPVLPKYVPEPRRPTQQHLSEKYVASTATSKLTVRDSIKTTTAVSAPVKTTVTKNSELSDLATTHSADALSSPSKMDCIVLNTLATPVESSVPSSIPRKFPAKFSHKMHMRAQAATSSVALPVNESDNKKPSETTPGIATRRRSSEQSNADSKKQNVQWTVTSKKSKMQVKKSKGGLPVLVIKAVPPKDSK